MIKTIEVNVARHGSKLTKKKITNITLGQGDWYTASVKSFSFLRKVGKGAAETLPELGQNCLVVIER